MFLWRTIKYHQELRTSVTVTVVVKKLCFVSPETNEINLLFVTIMPLRKLILKTSCVMRKSDFAYANSFAVTAKVISAFVLAS